MSEPWWKSYSLRRIVSLLLFNDSRKVAFGLWLSLVATGLISLRRIDGVQWLEAVALGSLLIGGGTLTDKWLDKVKPGEPKAPTV